MARAEPLPASGPGIADAGYGYDVFGASTRWVRGAAAALSPLYDHWFRVEAHDTHHLPARGPGIVVANHGGTLPFDAAMLWADVLRHTSPPRLLRPVADHFVSAMPFVGTIAARTGSVGGSRGNVRHLLEHGELLLVFPEGTPAIGKGIFRRYELLEFRVGHAELAIRHGAPVIPVAIVGPEEQLPQIGRIPIHRFGIPYLPIALFPVPLPVRYHIYYGEPILLHEAHSPTDADDPEVLKHAGERVRKAVWQLLDRGLRERQGIFR